jgi:hypothetical protein
MDVPEFLSRLAADGDYNPYDMRNFGGGGDRRGAGDAVVRGVAGGGTGGAGRAA